MGQVNYTEERVGDVADGDNIEDILDALATASANIQAENIRDEGLDHTNFPAAQAVRSDRFQSQTRTNIANPVLAVLNMGGNNVETGTFTLDVDEVFEVHAWMELPSDPTAANAALGFGIQDTPSAGVVCVLDMVLYGSFNAGPFLQIAPTRQVGMSEFGSDLWVMATTDISTAGTWKFQVWTRVSLAGASVNVDNVILTLKKFRRMT
jgi:hypothetical protein